MKENGRRWLIPLILALSVAVGALILRMGNGLVLWRMMARAWKQEQMVCKIHSEAPMLFDAEICWDTLGKKRYYTLDAGTESLYLCDGVLYFYGGKGLSLNGLTEELPVTEAQLRTAVLFAPWVRTMENGLDIWHLKIPEEPWFLIRILYPQATQYWNQLRGLEMELHGESGDLQNMVIRHEHLSLDLERKQEKPDPIPTDLLMQMGTAPLQDLRTLEPLFRACYRLIDAGSVRCDLAIRVDCGPLPIQDSAEILLSEEGLHLVRGDRKTALMSDSTQRQELLLGLGWTLLKEGTWEPSEPDGGIMRINLRGDAIRASLLSVIPELAGMELALDDGEVTVWIIHNRFSGAELDCGGQIPFLFAQIPLSIQLELDMIE